MDGLASQHHWIAGPPAKALGCRARRLFDYPGAAAIIF
jgi:hypothetical protein